MSTDDSNRRALLDHELTVLRHYAGGQVHEHAESARLARLHTEGLVRIAVQRAVVASEDAMQLARLLISNWIGALEDAVRMQPDAPLNIGVLPIGVAKGAIHFGLTEQQALDVVMAYQDALLKTQCTSRLSPTVGIGLDGNAAAQAFHAKHFPLHHGI